MTKRQMAFGVVCFLVGMLVGMAIAGNLEMLVRLVLIVAILLLCVYLVFPRLLPLSLPRRARVHRGPAQQVQQRRTHR